jgi:hypothetical protein
MTLREFWPMYLKVHRHPVNRLFHAVGTLGYLFLLFVLVATGHWVWIWALPLWAYGMAWTGHYAIEKNRPATFGHPFLSLFCDHRMVALMLAGRISAEYERLGIPQRT